MANTTAKRIKTEPVIGVQNPPGIVYVFGQGDLGQLGIEAAKRKYPAKVPELPNSGADIKQVCCGGTHTVVLSKDGKVYTFGNNDDLALGRDAEEEEDMRVPGQVELNENVAQVSAGDSHSAALTEDGTVYIWGNFRDANGNMGLIPGKGSSSIRTPQKVVLHENPGVKVLKIASGGNHLVMLGNDGGVYTCGCGEQGQLGRQKPVRKLRNSIVYSDTDFYLTPMQIKSSYYGTKKATDIWTGEYSTYVKAGRSGNIYAFGLNNWGQLGFEVGKDDENLMISLPRKSPGFGDKKWQQIAAGGHHALALDEDGKTYALGRPDDGRLGLGSEIKGPIPTPTLIPDLQHEKIILIACGLSTSYAVNQVGELFSWGFGDNWQLATGESDDEFKPVRSHFSKDDPNLKGVVCVSAGGQHAGIVLSIPEKIVENTIPVENGGTLKRKKAVKKSAKAAK